MRKVFVCMMLLGMAAALAIAGGSGEKAGEKITLTFWEDTWSGSEDPTTPSDGWYITKAIERFETANPSISINYVKEEDSQVSHHLFKAAAMTEDVPDVANLWTGEPIFNLAEVCLNLEGRVPKEDFDNLKGWETVRTGFSPDGELIGYPAQAVEICYFHYNKDLVKKAGLDFEASPPRTTSAFDTALFKIKATGVLPIAVDEGTDGWSKIGVQIGNYWWAQVSGLERIADESHGRAKFSDDQGFLQYMRYYHSLYANGFVNEDAATSDDSSNRFYGGECALVTAGNWRLAEISDTMGDNVGVLAPLDMPGAKVTNGGIGGPGQALVVAKGTKHPDEALKFIRHLESKDETLKMLERFPGLIPLRKDIDLDQFAWASDPLVKKVRAISDNYVYWVDNSMSAEVYEKYQRMQILAMTGKITPEEYAAEMDKRD
jgi:raffinose/stachyose/melibiose transport system substrate-binding protein